MSTLSMWQTVVTASFGFGGTAAGAYGAWHANRTKHRYEADNATRDDAREAERLIDERWQAYTSGLRADVELLLDPMRTQIAGLTAKVTALEAALDEMRARYRVAVDHIRELHRWADTDRAAPFPALPAPIANEV